jgi:hypothetical protein
LAIGLTALTLSGAGIEKSNAQGSNPDIGNSRATQQALRNTLLLPNPNTNGKHSANTYTVTPQEIAKARTEHSVQVIDYVSKFNRELNNTYSQKELAEKINLLIDTHPNFDASSQADKNKILAEIFPEFTHNKKVGDTLLWIYLSIVVS